MNDLFEFSPFVFKNEENIPQNVFQSIFKRYTSHCSYDIRKCYSF